MNLEAEEGSDGQKSDNESKFEKFISHKNYMLILTAVAITLLIICLCMCCWVRSKTTALEKKQKQLEDTRTKELAALHFALKEQFLQTDQEMQANKMG